MSALQRFADSIRASPCVREVPNADKGRHCGDHLHRSALPSQHHRNASINSATRWIVQNGCQVVDPGQGQSMIDLATRPVGEAIRRWPATGRNVEALTTDDEPSTMSILGTRCLWQWDLTSKPRKHRDTRSFRKRKPGEEYMPDTTTFTPPTQKPEHFDVADRRRRNIRRRWRLSPHETVPGNELRRPRIARELWRHVDHAPLSWHPLRQRSLHVRLSLQAVDRHADRDRCGDPGLHG